MHLKHLITLPACKMMSRVNFRVCPSIYGRSFTSRSYHTLHINAKCKSWIGWLYETVCQFYELRFDGWDATAALSPASIFQGQSGFAAASNTSGGLSLSSVPVRMIVWRTLKTYPMLRIYKSILVWHWAHLLFYYCNSHELYWSSELI